MRKSCSIRAHRSSRNRSAHGSPRNPQVGGELETPRAATSDPSALFDGNQDEPKNWEARRGCGWRIDAACLQRCISGRPRRRNCGSGPIEISLPLRRPSPRCVAGCLPHERRCVVIETFPFLHSGGVVEVSQEAEKVFCAVWRFRSARSSPRRGNREQVRAHESDRRRATGEKTEAKKKDIQRQNLHDKCMKCSNKIEKLYEVRAGTNLHTTGEWRAIVAAPRIRLYEGMQPSAGIEELVNKHQRLQGGGAVTLAPTSRPQPASCGSCYSLPRQIEQPRRQKARVQISSVTIFPKFSPESFVR